MQLILNKYSYLIKILDLLQGYDEIESPFCHNPA